MSFADLGLSPELLKAVNDAGYDTPTPIQEQAIPPVLMMRDIIGIAQTGTGKTASFVLPMIDILAQGRSRARMPRSLILEPTRELAAQVAENFEKYGANHKLSMALLIGGVSMGDQIKALEKGVDVLIATPGRLMDLFGRGNILLTGCSLLVIDEADRMLDMGFIPDIEEICTKLPKQRQTLLFSATMPAPIKKLADKFLDNPKRIEVARPASTNINITQWLVQVKQADKRERLRRLLGQPEVTNAIVFCNRKTTVRELNKSLKQAGFRSGEIHGDMEQPQRLAELELFKKGDVTILVASDVAARGLDIKGVSTVFNYDAPWHPDDYVHRIGRTGRAGATGTAYTFAAPDDAENIDNIEKLTGQKIPRLDATATEAEPVAEAPVEREARPRRGRRPDRAEAPREITQVAEPVAEVQPQVQAQSPQVLPPPREARRAEPAPRPERQDDRQQERSDHRRDTRQESRDGGHQDVRHDGRSSDRRDRYRRDERDDGPDDGWNGPVPDFLKVALVIQP